MNIRNALTILLLIVRDEGIFLQINIFFLSNSILYKSVEEACNVLTTYLVHSQLSLSPNKVHT